MEYLYLFFIASTFIFWLLVIWRVTHPFTCACGYQTWFIGLFKKHILQGHKWIDPHP